MLTKIIKNPAPGSKKLNKNLVLWLGSLLMGLIAFAGVWALQDVLARSRFMPLLSLQNAAYDRGMSSHAYRFSEKNPAQGPLAVVAIKEATPELVQTVRLDVPGVKQVSYKTHPRAFHARLIENLTRLGAKVIVFDVVFNRGVTEEQFTAQEKAVDAYLAQAIKKHGKVILAAQVEQGSEAAGGAARSELTYPDPTLFFDAAGIGVANIPEDPDRTLRKFRWWYRGMDYDTGDDTDIPTLGVAAAALYSDRDPKTIVQEEVQPKGTFLGKAFHFQPVGDPKSPSRVSQMRYYAQAGFPNNAGGAVLNYEDVLFRGQQGQELEKLRERIAGKVVYIGDASQLGHDYHRTPVSSEILGQGGITGHKNEMPGVEVQSHITHSLLRGEDARYAPQSWNLLLTLLACLAVALIGRVVPTIWMVPLTLAAIGGIWFGTNELMATRGIFLEPVTASAGAAAALLLETGYMYAAERKQRAAVRRQLSRHIGAGVADRLTEEEWPELSGESREITMLFSDLQGFTSLSETMTSPEICSLLNKYFGVIFPVVDRYGGTLDKLMGDGMMVYFGWPQRHLDHAARAIRCALEIQDALEDWQRQPEFAGSPPLKTRIGLHTGLATIGEIGGGNRVEFTVIGDVVNTASRLEGMNKDYGTTILISENVREAAGEIAPMTYRGAATVRGKKEPVPVYSVETGASTGRHRTSARTGSASFSVTGPQSAPQSAPVSEAQSEGQSAPVSGAPETREQ